MLALSVVLSLAVKRICRKGLDQGEWEAKVPVNQGLGYVALPG